MAGFSTVVLGQEQWTERQINFFEEKIRPVLVEHCYECHSGESKELKAGLLLDSRQAVLAGGDSGPAAVPGQPDQSLLIESLNFESYEMPPAGRLPDEVIADFEKWIEMGLPDPRQASTPENVKDQGREAGVTPVELWSLKPISPPRLPESASGLHDGAAVVDHLLENARLQAGVQAVGPADRLTLLRRVYFDLVGLPPTLEAIDQFAQDNSPRALEDVVDRLLASPQYGQRWGRHWLDVVRYGESMGSSRDVLMLHAWRYRDYVIEAFNRDLPYDQFIQQQVAGDLLPCASPAEQRNNLIATGFLSIGSKSLNGGNLELDIVDDQIDVIGKAILGLTISCARCHDHKFDPIPTADYYALAGIFRNTRTFYGGDTRRPANLKEQLAVYLPLPGGDHEMPQDLAADLERLAELDKQFAELEKRLKALEKKLPKDWQEQLKELRALEKPSKADAKLLKQFEDAVAAQAEKDQTAQELAEIRQRVPELDFAFGTQDKDEREIRDWPIQIRGDKRQNGDIVPRGMLTCVNLSSSSPDKAANPTVAIDAEQSGRLELAQWLTHPSHPLTSRVIVNRVWQHLFGEGLVASVDNFGASGQPPSHPELLDYLSDRFVQVHRWSIKSLIRELVLTDAYKLASRHDAENFQIDAENRLIWRRSRLRLEAEALRDAMLAASGMLRAEPLPGSLVQQIGEGEVGRNIKTACLDEPFHYRSVYLPIIRGIIPEFMMVFDLPEPSNVQGRRDVTNVPAQALFLMNSPFVLQQAQRLADRVCAQASLPESRIDLLLRLTLGRPASQAEVLKAMDYLDTGIAGLQSSDHIAGQDPHSAERDRWIDLCQAMFARAEFRYLD